MELGKKWVVGIDEVGRGPIAGPVTVCALMVPEYFHKNLSGQFDSKKLTHKTRENISNDLQKMRREGIIFYKIVSISAKVIDQKGIVHAVNLAISRALNSLGVRDSKLGECEILMDGGLRAPKTFTNQKAIIHGDALVPLIGLASVLAKVHRDKIMTNLGVRHLSWGFEKHKGYGIRAHYKAIKKHGLSEIHRLTYCKNVIV